MLAEGDGDGLGSVRRADLLKERFDVFLYHVDADPKLLCDVKYVSAASA